MSRPADKVLSPKTAREIRSEVARDELHPFNDELSGAVPPGHPDYGTPSASLNDSDLRDRTEVRLGPETPIEMAERHQIEDAREEVLDSLRALREMQGGEGVIFRVHRIAMADGQPLRHAPQGEFCGEIGASQLDQSIIADLFGGGKYVVKGRYSNGTFAGQRTIVIAGDVRRRDVNAPVSAGPAFNLQEFMAMQEAREDKRRAEAKRDRMELLAALGPIVAPIIAAMVGRQPAPQTDLPALITALRPTVQPENPLTSMKGMMEMLVMMKDMTGDGGGSETAEILKAVSGIAAPILTAVAQRPPGAPVRPRVSAPQPAGAPVRGLAPPAASPLTVRPAPTPVELPGDRPTMIQPNPALDPGADLSQPSNPQESAMFAQMKPQIDALVQMAEQGADGIVVADTFFEQALLAMPQELYDQIVDLVEHPQFLARVGIFNPGVKTHAAFFTALRTRILERVQEQEKLAQQENQPS